MIEPLAEWKSNKDLKIEIIHDKINEMIKMLNFLEEHEHRDLRRGGPHPDMNYDDYLAKDEVKKWE